MKKLWKSILLLSVMFVLAMSVRSFAATTQYSARTISFPNAYGGGWSNQFTLSAQTNITVGINMYSPTGAGFSPATIDKINKSVTYLLENVKTHQKYYLTDITYNSLTYDVHMSRLPAGTYSFGAYYSGSLTLNMYFRVTGTPGINIPDNLEIKVGDYAYVSITQQNVWGGYMYVDSYYSDRYDVADVTEINNSTVPPQIRIQAKSVGTAIITVYGTDGSSDTMQVTVTQYDPKGTLLYKTLTLNGGEVVYNEVLQKPSNATVRWTSSDKDVAKVTKKTGKITAVGAGKCTIKAEVTLSNGNSYTLPCSVTVLRSDPDFSIQLTNFAPKKLKLKIQITNNSGADMIVYSGGSRLLQMPDYMPIRTLKMRNAKKMVIKNGKTVKVPFYIKGSKLPGRKADYGVRVKFKLDGIVYYARCSVNKLLGQYILKNNLATNNWLYALSLG